MTQTPVAPLSVEAQDAPATPPPAHGLAARPRPHRNRIAAYTDEATKRTYQDVEPILTPAFVGSHRVNGVSALHTELMRLTTFHDFHTLYPDRIVNKTNGITFRRWLYQANPKLTEMLVEALGPDILDKPEERLVELEPFAEKQTFRKAFAEQRLHSKRALAEIIHERLGIAVNPAAMFDVQGEA